MHLFRYNTHGKRLTVQCNLLKVPHRPVYPLFPSSGLQDLECPASEGLLAELSYNMGHFKYSAQIPLRAGKASSTECYRCL